MKKINFTVLLIGLLSILLFASLLLSCSTTKKNDSKKEILVVSFGTSYNDSREKTIGAIENAIKKQYSSYTVARAFTSQTIIKILKSRDGIEIDNVEEALNRAIDNGIKDLIVQPTHLMSGHEFNDLQEEVLKYNDSFDKVVISKPLLTSDEDFLSVAKAITQRTKDYDDGHTAICFMGHGTDADSNSVYAKMQNVLEENGYKNYYIGTVEATPSVYDLLKTIKANKDYTNIVLQPLMVVAGDHANNDMAGDDEDSWKSVFESEGFSVECILEGLGENPLIQNIYVSHVKDAESSL